MPDLSAPADRRDLAIRIGIVVGILAAAGVGVLTDRGLRALGLVPVTRDSGTSLLIAAVGTWWAAYTAWFRGRFSAWRAAGFGVLGYAVMVLAAVLLARR